MADFIEVHLQGKPRLVNLDWVEDIWPRNDLLSCSCRKALSGTMQTGLRKSSGKGLCPMNLHG